MKKIPQILFALLLACMVSTAAAQTKKGDVNGDGQVTVADVTALVNVILGKATRNDACDVNGTPQLLLTILLLGNLPMLRGAVATMERITKDNKSRPTFEK